MERLTVQEIALAAATQLGIEGKVREYFLGVNTEGEEEAKTLVRCFNLIESELALDYLPLYAEEELESKTGAVYYDEFDKPIVRVVKITDEWDNDVKFKLYPEYVKTQGGKLKITYTYAPTEKTKDDATDYAAQVTLRLFTFGVLAEYALAHGRFEEAAIWDKKYKDSIAAAYRSNPSVKLRARRWA